MLRGFLNLAAEVQHHLFLNSAVGGFEWSSFTTRLLYPVVKPSHPLNIRPSETPAGVQTSEKVIQEICVYLIIEARSLNHLAPELFFLISAHPVYKM